jgi:hypothetical protein
MQTKAKFKNKRRGQWAKGKVFFMTLTVKTKSGFSRMEV